MARKRTPKTPKSTPAPQRALKLEALEPRILMTATSEASLANDLKTAIHAQLEHWETQLDIYANTKVDTAVDGTAKWIDASFGDLLREVDSTGKVVTENAVTLKALLKETIASKAKEAVQAIDTKVAEVVDAATDKATITLRQVAEKLGTKQATTDGKETYEATVDGDWGEGVTLVRRATLTESGNTQTLTLSLHFKSADRSYEAQGLAGSFSRLGVTFDKNPILSGHAQFDVVGDLSLTRNYVEQDKVVDGQVVMVDGKAVKETVLQSYTATESLKDLGADFQANLKDVNANFDMGILKFDEKTDSAETAETDQDLQVRLQAKTLRAGTTATVTGKAEVAMDLEAEVTGNLLGYSKTERFDIKQSWTTEDKLSLGDFEQRFGGFHKVSAGDIVAQLQKIQTWLQSLLSESGKKTAAADGATEGPSAADKLNQAAMNSRLDSSAGFAKTFQEKVFANDPSKDNGLVQTNSSGQVTKLLFSSLDELGTKLVALGVMDQASDLSYDETTKVISAKLHLSGDFLTKELPASFDLLGGTGIANLKSNSDFATAGHGEVRFTLLLDVGNTNGSLQTSTELKGLTNAAGDVAKSLVDRATLQASQGDGGRVLPSGVLGGDVRFAVVVVPQVIDKTKGVITQEEESFEVELLKEATKEQTTATSDNTSLEDLAADLQTVINAAAKAKETKLKATKAAAAQDAATVAAYDAQIALYAQGYVVKVVGGGVQIGQAGTKGFEIRAAENQGAFAELGLSTARSVATVTADNALSVATVSATTQVSFKVQFGEETYTVTSKSPGTDEKDGEGLAGLVDRINRGMDTALDSDEVPTGLLSKYGLFASLDATNRIVLTANPSLYASDANYKNSPLPFTLSNATSLGFNKDTATEVLLSVAGREMISQGRLAKDLTVGLTLDGVVYTVSLPKLDLYEQITKTDDTTENGALLQTGTFRNTSLADLQKQLQDGLDAALEAKGKTASTDGIEVILKGDVFSFKVRNKDSTLALDAASSKNLDQIGFKDEVANSADLKVFYQDGSTQLLDLNKAVTATHTTVEELTIEDIIAYIKTETKTDTEPNGRLTVSIAQVQDPSKKTLAMINGPSLVIHEKVSDVSKMAVGKLAGILSWNGSSAAKLLGIEGVHRISKADLDEAKKNGTVSRTGDGIIGTPVADRFKVKDLTASARMELDVPAYEFKGTKITAVDGAEGTVTVALSGADAKKIDARFGGQYLKIQQFDASNKVISSTRIKIEKVSIDSAGTVTLMLKTTLDNLNTATGKTDLAVNKTFDAVIEGVQVSASIGPVGVHLIGRNGSEGSLGRQLDITFENDTAYTVGNMLKAFKDSTVTFGAITDSNKKPIATKMVFDVIEEGISLPGNKAGTITLEMATGAVVPTVTADFSPLNGALDQLTKLSSDEILDGLDKLVDTLQKYTDQDNPNSQNVFNQKIPGIDKSLNEMVDIVQDIKAAVDEAKGSGKGDLMGILQVLRNRLGLSDQAVTGINSLVATVVSVPKPTTPALARSFAVATTETTTPATTTEATTEEKVLRFHLVLGKKFSEKGNLKFADANGLEVGGSAEVYANGNVNLDFSFDVILPEVAANLKDPKVLDKIGTASLVVRSGSKITADLDVGGENLKFNLGLNVDGVQVNDLIEVGGKDTTKPSFFKAAANMEAKSGKDIRIDLSADTIDVVVGKQGQTGNTVDMTLTANVGAQLPVYVVGSFQGEIKLGEWDDATNLLSIFDGKDAGTVKAKDKGKVDLDGLANLKIKTFTDAEENDDKKATGYDATKDIADGAVTLDISQLVTSLKKLTGFAEASLFEKVKLAVDGLDMALGGIQDQLEGKFSDKALDMPILGDALANGADFVADLRDKFLDPFREFVENASSLNEHTVANFLQEQLQAQLKLAGVWESQVTVEANKADGTAKTADEIKAEKTALLAARWGRNFDKNSGNIAYRKLTKAADNTNGAEWAFHLSGTYAMGTNFGLDLGVPGLGLKTSGGVDAGLTWSLDLGFGISEAKGFYLILPQGDEVKVDVKAEVSDGTTLTGALGFLGLKATNPDVQAFLKLGLDLNDMQGKATDSQGKTVAADAAGTLGLSSLGSLRADVTVEARADVNLDITVGIGDKDGTNASFPDIEGRFEFQWVFEKGSKDTITGVRQAGFEDVKIDLGQYVKNVLQPVARQIKKVTDPVQPLVDFLTTPFPVLRDIGVRLTPLDLAKIYDKSAHFGFIDSIAKLAKMADTIDRLVTSIGSDGKIDLGDFFLVGKGDGTGKKGSGAATQAATGDKATALSGKAAASGLKIENLLGDEVTKGSDVLSGIKTKMLAKLGDSEGATFGKSSDANQDEAKASGLWTFPIVQDPSQIFGLLLGRDATLVHYKMAPLKFNFQYSQYFPIVGPIGARIGVNLGADMRFAFGYDTAGIRAFVSHDYNRPLDLLDGFYVDDYYGGQVDVPEIALHGGLSASAELNLGIASGGVGGGVGINVDFDMNDPNHDGKVRLGEMVENVENEAKYGNILKAPLAVFDIHGKIYAELYAYLNTFWHDYRWQITSPITIAEFDVKFTRAAKMAEVNKDTMLVHVGDLSAGRLNGDLTDGNEEFTLDITGDTAKLSSNKYPASGQKYDLKGVGKIRIDAAKGNDTIKITGSSSRDIEILGGVGNDSIDLSDYTVASGGLVVIKGQEGDDVIKGPAVSDGGEAYLFGDEGSLIRNSSKVVLGAQGTMNAEGDGSDRIVGTSGRTVIFGGGGKDFLAGGSGNDYVFGDEGRILFKDKAGATLSPVAIDRTQLHDGGGDDVVVGGAGDDLLYGGTGNDAMDGGAGGDTIYGEKGNDRILGGSGGDNIDGGAGQDIVFGDRIAADVNLETIFPAAELPKEIKVHTIKVKDFEVTDAATDTGAVGGDNIKGGQGSDILFGDDGAFDSATGGVDNISGGLDNDLISGDGGNDVLTGEVGNDVLYGGAGSDAIDGGAGDDIVYGGNGYRGLVGVAALPDNALVYGDNRAKGFAGNTAAEAETNDQDDTIQAGLGSDTIDGQGGDDRVYVNFQGGNAKSVTNVADTGASGRDKLTITATVGDDDLLMRASKDGLGFVALLPQDTTHLTSNGQSTKSNLERINFWKDGIDNVQLDASLGKDVLAIDGTVAKTVVDLGGGNDEVMIGQLYVSDRTTSAKVDGEDLFTTVETPDGFLSEGATKDTVIKGGNGNDTFNVLANTAQVSLEGGRGNDTFALSSYVRMDDTTIAHGAVNVDGGEGKDVFTLGGSQGNDTFFVTDKGILSSVGKTSATGVESSTVVAGAGDDTFHVLSTLKDSVTHIEGGLGNDTVDVGGLAEGVSFAGTETDTYTTGFVAKVTASNVSDFAVGAVTEQVVNVMDASAEIQPVFVDASDNIAGTMALRENGSSSVYVTLSRDLAADETVSITLMVPLVDDAVAQYGGKGLSLSTDGTTWTASVVLTFTATDNGTPKLVTIKAEDDSLYEGNQALKLNAIVTTGTGDSAVTRNAALSFNVDVTETMAKPTAGVFSATKKESIVWVRNSWGFWIPKRVSSSTPVDTLEIKGQSTIELAYEIEPSASGLVVKLTQDGTVKTISERTGSAGEQGLHYILDGKKLLLWDSSTNRLSGQTGTLSISGYQLLAPSGDTFEAQGPAATEAAQVLILPTNGDLSLVEGEEVGNTFLVKLSKDLKSGESVTVSLSETDYGDTLERAKLKFDKSSVTFDGTNNEGILVRIVAEDDEKTNEVGQEFVAASPNNFGAIQGAVYAEGEGATKVGALPAAVLLKQTAETSDPLNETDTTKGAASTTSTSATDERASTDRIFFHGQDETADRTSELKRLVPGGSSELEVDFADRMDAMRFTQEGTLATEGVTFGDFEFTEVDLGSGEDTVTVSAAANRQDGFRTLTVFNTGNEGDSGDSVNIASLQAEIATVIASGVVDSSTSAIVKVDGDAGKDAELAGFQFEVTGLDGSVQRRTILRASYDSGTGLTSIELDRSLASDAAGLAWQVIADVRQDGIGSLDADAISDDGMEITLGDALDAFADEAGSIQVGDLLELFVSNGRGGISSERRVITAVDDGTVTVDKKFGISDATSYRVWRRTDGLLAVNLQDGDDTITSTSGAVTGSLIAFGGKGKDTIVTGASVYAFGDRGQVRYATEDGTVTLLGTDDAGNDYTTAETLGKLQTDGVVRAATSFKTYEDTIGDDDTIIAAGKDSVIFGGAGTDNLTVTGEHNFVYGDAGKVEFAAGGTSAWADRQSQNPMSASTTNDAVGAQDVITITGGRNTVMGGAGSDVIHVNAPAPGSATGDNTVLGDGGSVVWESGLVKSVTTTSNTVGGVDDIQVAGDGNRVMGGAAGDTIEITGGNNTVLGDGGQALWIGGVLQSVKTVDDSVGGVDLITVGGKRNAVMGGAAGDSITLIPGSENGDNTVLGDGGTAVWENGKIKSLTSTSNAVGGVDNIVVTGDDNRVMGGAAGDSIKISGGDNTVLGDGGQALWIGGVLQSVKTVDDAVGGVDIITVGGRHNAVMGGAAGDTITLIPGSQNGDNTVLGDGGMATWENGLIKYVQTTNDAVGDADTLHVTGDDNRVMGGAAGDTIDITGGKNVVLGDGGVATWNAGVLQSVTTTNDAVGGVDAVDVYGGDNVVMGGADGDVLTVHVGANGSSGNNTVLGDGGSAAWENGLIKVVKTTSDAIGGVDNIAVHGDVNRVMGGADNDIISIGGGKNVALGDGGVATWNAGVLQTVSTTSDDIGGNDKLTIVGGTNVVMGGNGQDNIGITGSDNVALGDGGTVTYRTNGNLQRVQTKSDNLGGSDTITTGDGANIAFGGFAADVITTGAGDDVIVGDGGFADFDVNGQKLLVSNEGQALGGNDVIDAGIGLNTVMGGMGDDLITTGIKRDSKTADARDAWANDKDVVLGDNGSRSFQGSGTAVEGRTSATLSFNFQGGYGQGMTASMLAGANGYRTSNWNNLTGIGASTYGNDAAEIVRADNGQRLEGLDLSWGGKEGHRTPSIETNGYLMQGYDPNAIKDANGAAQLGDGLLFAGGVRTSAPNTQSENKLEVEMAGLSKYFKSYSVVVYLDASSEVSSLIQNPQDSALAKQLGKTTGESIRKVNVSSGTVNDSYFLDDAASSTSQTYNTFNGNYVKATAKDAVSAYGQYANYVVFDGLTDDRFVVTITDGVLNVNYNGRDLPSIAGIQIIGQYWPTDTIKSSTTETGGNDVISTGGGSDVVIGGAGSDAIATFGDVRHGVNDADTVIGDNGTVSEMVRANGLATGTSVVQAVATGFAVGTDLTGATFDDVIVTGNGNDVVIGGDGQDRINTERQDDLDSGIATVDALDVFKTSTPEALQKGNLELLQNQETSGLKVLSLNMSYSYRDGSKDDSQLNVADKQYAGAVAARNWNNVQLQDELSPVQYANPYTNKTFLLNDGTAVASGFNMNFRARDVGSTGNPTSVQADRSNGQEQIDPDSENSKLFKSSLWVQQQQQLEVNLNGIRSKAGFDTYDVYVYIDGDNERTDADNWIYEVKGTNLDNGKSDTNYLNDWRGNTFNGEFRQVTAKNTDVTKIDQSVIPNRALIGNYVVFQNVTAENFQVMLRNHKVGSQSPMNQPSIAGIQIVGKTNVAANQKNLPLNGDYDKDVVLGDNGKVNLTVDVPYGYDASPDRALNPLQNKACEAISDVTSKVGGTAASQSDVIVTGRNQDIVLGGNGSDAIDAGSGDDVVLGDNGIIQMSDYNPIGVRQPLNLKMVDATQTDNATYIGKAGFNRDQFVQKLQNGQVPGVQSIASSLSGNDVVDAGRDNDLVLGQEGDDALIGNTGTDDVLYDTVGSNKVKDVAYTTQAAYLQDLNDVLALLDAEGQGLLKGSFSVNDFGRTSDLGVVTKGIGSGTGSTTPVAGTTNLRSFSIGSSASSPINVAAGEEIVLTATAGSYPTSGNIGLSFGANGATIPAFTLSWVVNGATQTASVAAGQWWVSPVREIPDLPNDNGKYTIKLKAATSGSFTVQMTNW